ncbi:MAG: hypothetical protein JSU70_13225 [Phycisphaerales bacterium]|nr:MAG: hypothetical protein JSU70_13225 [Phycisphaerales bacterium]
MGFDYSKKEQKLAAVVLVGVSVLLAVTVLVKMASFLATTAKAENMVSRAERRAAPNGDDMKVHLAESKADADRLKKKNLFASPPPRKHPVKEVSGILGSEVLIAGKWYSAGGKVADAKIVTVGSTDVTIEWDGKEKVFAPIAATIVGGPKKDASRKSVGEKKAPAEGVAVKPVEREVAAAPAEKDVLAWIGVKLSEKLRSKFLEKWNGLSKQEQAEAKTKWKSMSDEQRKQAVEGMERRM